MSAPVHEALPEGASDSAQAAGESRHRYPPRAVLLDYLYAASACSSPSARWGWQGLAVPPPGRSAR